MERLSKYVPKTILGLAARTLLAGSLLGGAACTKAAPDSKDGNGQDTQTLVKEFSNPNGFLIYPFSESIRAEMQLQQAWFYQSGDPHYAADYVRGKIDDSSTWKPFSVLATADGFACANPGKQQGNAVWTDNYIERANKTVLYHTYSGHLAKIAEGIPECNDSSGKRTGQTKSVKKGEEIGIAGSTGMADSSLLHLHYEVKDSKDQPVDPYGLESKRDDYPNPALTNGKKCGKAALFANCPVDQGFELVRKAKAAEPLATPQELVIENGRPVPTFTPEPTPTKTATPVPDKKSNFKIGDLVEVYNTGSCLNIREQPITDSKVKKCLPDGTPLHIDGGPTNSGIFTWWKIAEENGWGVEDYLRIKSGSSISAEIPQSWKSYRSKDFPYEMQIPSGWMCDKMVIVTGEGCAGPTASGFLASVNVIVEPIKNPGFTLQDYANDVVTRTKQGLSLYANVTYESQKPKKLTNGTDAIELVATTNPGAGKIYKLESYVIIKNNQGWQIDLVVETSGFPQTLPVFDRIISTLNITG